MANINYMSSVVVFLVIIIASSIQLGDSLRSPSSFAAISPSGPPGGTCNPSGYLPGSSHSCNTENDSDCCKTGHRYPQYKCSPPITTSPTSAHMTINSFAEGGDGGGPSECDNIYHSDTEMVVALSTGWYSHGSRCLHNIRINANGRSVLAKVVDECDSVYGCDADHDYQPPCPNNIVDASPAVWKALGIPNSQVGDYDITWSDA